MHEKRRNEVIDAFRAFAIIAVVLYHYTVRWAPPHSATDLYHYGLSFPAALELGQLGVQVFFVISGIVIAMTITASRSAITFGVKRMARLYPAYIAASVVIFVLMRWCGPKEFRASGRDFLATMTMVAPNLHKHFVEGSFWSLAVEVKFYAWTALAFFLLKERWWVGLVTVAIAGLALTPLWPALADEVFLARYMPFFLLGVAVWLEIYARQRKPALALFAVAALSYPLCAPRVYGALPLAWQASAHLAVLGPIALMVGLLRFAGSMRFGPIAYIGRASYSWYLLHQRLGVTLIGYLRSTWHLHEAVAIAVAMIVTLAAACAMFEIIEHKAQRAILNAYALRDRLPWRQEVATAETHVCPMQV